MGMSVSVPKTKVLVFNVHLYTCGLPWAASVDLCGRAIGIVAGFKYLGIMFDAMHGMAVTFLSLKKIMIGTWALLKRRYGRLQCLASNGLMFRVEPCVPPSGLSCLCL